jgi:hypothetical protein
MFATVNTQSSSKAVVPPSAGISPTNVIRRKASSVVKPIATYSVRRLRCTLPSTNGKTR